MLGGSSSINAMIYIRGNPLDYDAWRDAGCPAGAGTTCCPTSCAPRTTSAAPSEFHGAGGPLPVSEARAAQRDAARRSWRPPTRRACPRNEDFNDGEQDGFGYYQVTQRDGRRASTAVAYLHPVMDRPNLTVETHAHVLKVLFDGARARGVGGACAAGETLDVSAPSAR